MGFDQETDMHLSIVYGLMQDKSDWTNKIEKTLTILRKNIKESDKSKWNSFYKYFRVTWMKRFEIRTWNRSNAKDENIEIINRTNNALENYNRRLNEAFPISHPNFYVFINTIKRLAVQKVAEWTKARKNC
ncbi:hypothetical protein HZS_4183 [Henneguya salminicola]|nr:hypothetical protein HZS_4183 [Henneguya salminicola]